MPFILIHRWYQPAVMGISLCQICIGSLQSYNLQLRVFQFSMGIFAINLQYKIGEQEQIRKITVN